MGSFTESWSYLLAAMVTFTLCLLVSTVVLVLHVHLLHQLPKKKAAVTSSSTSRVRSASIPSTRRRQQSAAVFQEQVYDYFDSGEVHKQVLWYCTGLSLSAFYLQIVFSFFYRLNDLRLFGSHNWCDDYIKILSFLWCIGKYMMYMVFIARVRVAFSQTAYCYSNRTVFVLYFAVSAVVLPLIAAVPWFTGGRTKEVTGNAPNDKVTVCVSEINRYYAVVGFLVDAAISPSLVVLFIRPLRKFFRDASHHVSKQASIRDIEVQLLPLKYTVTMAIGVISAVSGMLLMAATDAGVLVIMDSVVNMICLVTMTSHWKRVYWRLCAPLLQTIAFFNCCFDDPLRANLSRIIAFFSSDAEMEKYRKELTASKIGSSKAMSKSLSSNRVSSKEHRTHVIEVTPQHVL